MKILITGASSYVGARLYIDLKKTFDVVGTYYSHKIFSELIRLDITHKDDSLDILSKERPDIVVHVAANPNGKWCEANPEKAVQINKEGTENIVLAANKIGAKVVYISSVAALAPTNVYGKTKLAGEIAAKYTRAVHIIIQPSLIVGWSPNETNDRFFNRLLKNVRENTPAVYDTSWKCMPTWLGHISEVIDLCIKKEIVNEVIPITVPEQKTRFDLASDILSALKVAVEPKDDGDKTAVINVPQEQLKRLGLPVYSYSQIIEKCKAELQMSLGTSYPKPL